jgi:hypothetical protein
VGQLKVTVPDTPLPPDGSLNSAFKVRQEGESSSPLVLLNELLLDLLPPDLLLLALDLLLLALDLLLLALDLLLCVLDLLLRVLDLLARTTELSAKSTNKAIETIFMVKNMHTHSMAFATKASALHSIFWSALPVFLAWHAAAARRAARVVSNN